MKNVKSFFILLLKLIFTGIAVGLLIGTYQFLGHKIIHLSRIIYEDKFILNYILMAVVGLLGFYVVRIIIDKIPYVSGGGIPQMELTIEGKYDIKYYLSIPFMIISSYITFFLGLGIGSEGPSILLSGSVGIMANKIFKNDDKELIAVASGAGFASAFLSPYAGVVYVFEEALDYKFNFKLLFKAIVVVFIAYFFSQLLNKHLILDITIDFGFKPKEYIVLIFLVIINLILGCIFIFGLIGMKKFINKHPKIFKYRMLFVILLTIVLGFIATKLLGSESHMISLCLENKGIQSLILLLIFKFIFTFFSANSNMSGGLLVPILAVGALGGAITYSLCSNVISEDLLPIIIYISCLTIYAITTKSFFTSIALALNFAPINLVILPICITALLGVLISEFLKTRCIYEYLKEFIEIKEELKEN